jgi:hypothetical protein
MVTYAVVATKYPSVLFFGYDTLNSLLAGVSGRL